MGSRLDKKIAELQAELLPLELDRAELKMLSKQAQRSGVKDSLRYALGDIESEIAQYQGEIAELEARKE